MNSLVQQTLQLNNDGVAYFTSNDSAAAAEHLGRSLHFAAGLVRDSEGISDGFAESCKNHPDQCVVGRPIVTPIYGGKSVVSSTARWMQDRLFVYQNPLVLTQQLRPDGDSCDNRDSHRSLCTHAAAICYNLALLYHHDGMANRSNRSTTKAGKLYGACIAILSDSNLAHWNESTLLIAIAASNNLAVIEFERGMLDNVTNRLRHLSMLLRESEHVNLHMLATDELHNFLSNILLGNGLTAAPAA